MDKPPVYETYEMAARRVESLKSCGIWPGILSVKVHDRVFTYRLSYDPPLTKDEIAYHGGRRSP